jgi:hypothetical protein
MTHLNPIRPGFNWSQLFDVVGLPDGVTVAGATITANLVTPDGATVLIPPAAQSDGVGGAAWSQNRVLVEFTAANTGLTAVVNRKGQNAMVQVFVTVGAKTNVYEAGVVPVRETKAT